MNTAAFLESIQRVVDGDARALTRTLRASPEIATMALPPRRVSSQAREQFFESIRHYMYGGDTALHMAAAAFSRPLCELLIAHGADCRARNRRGAEPLHYASDANRSDARAQAETIECLITNGADPGATDKSGVAPLHRAVRTRSLGAVQALLNGGANPRQRNGSGSTPLHLAVQNTGRSGSGSDEARKEQAAIITLLLASGAHLGDMDARGRRVADSATSEWVRLLLKQHNR